MRAEWSATYLQLLLPSHDANIQVSGPVTGSMEGRAAEKAVLGNRIKKMQQCAEALMCMPEARMAADTQPLEPEHGQDADMMSAPEGADKPEEAQPKSAPAAPPPPRSSAGILAKRRRR